MQDKSERNTPQELIVAILKSGSAFTVPGGILGETEQDYLMRLAVAVSQLSDQNWNAIPEWAQAWYDETASMMNAWYDDAGNLKTDRRPLVTCPGIPKDAFILSTPEPPEAKHDQPAMPKIPETAKEDAETTSMERLRLPQEQASACQMAESTSKAGKTVLEAPALKSCQAGTASQQTSMPIQPAAPRLSILDTLHVIMAEHLSDVASKPTAAVLREELARLGYRKLSSKLIGKEYKSFERTVEALKATGKMQR